MKALLLNLPFTRKVSRDMGCPHTVKASYYLPQADLLCFGAMLKGRMELEYLDCIMEGMDEEKALKRIAAMQPDHVFTIVSSITLDADRKFLSSLKKALPETKIWASGDVMLFRKEEYPEVDFHIRDFTNREGVIALLDSGAGKGSVERSASNRFSMGVSPHEFVRKHQYFLPHSLHCPTTGVLTNYGCPFKCRFCNSGKLNFKKRDMDEVIRELRHIKELGIKDLFFRDYTFAVPDMEKLCDAMISENLGLDWSCETRVDVVNEKLLAKMKAAGCYLIFYGVESGNDDTLKRMSKGFATARVREIVKKTKDLGIEVLTSFILGLPGDDIGKTIAFMFELDPDYLSINLLVPRVGSTIREDLGAEEGSNTDCLYSSPELVKKRNETERRFYLRPSKLAHYLRLSSKSGFRLHGFIQNGIGLVRKWASSGPVQRE